MADVFFPAAAKQLPCPVVITAGIDEQAVVLKIAAARTVDSDPVGKLAALVMAGQGRNQFAIPEIGVGVVEAMGTCPTEIGGKNTHVTVIVREMSAEGSQLAR